MVLTERMVPMAQLVPKENRESKAYKAHKVLPVLTERMERLVPKVQKETKVSREKKAIREIPVNKAQ